jgi:hypothetical protein
MQHFPDISFSILLTALKYIAAEYRLLNRPVFAKQLRRQNGQEMTSIKCLLKKLKIKKLPLRGSPFNSILFTLITVYE